MTVLYLTEPGATLSATSKALVVRRRDAPRAQVPVLGIERVIVLAPTHLTSAALALCARERVELVVVPRGPGVLVRMGGSEAGLALRGAQHRAAGDAAFCLAFARAVVAGKVRNQRRLLGRTRASAEPAVSAARDTLGVLAAKAVGAPSVATLRGMEGRASAVYFRALRTLFNPEYGFRGRNRRPPRDPANALLGFVYTLVTTEAAAALAAAGLEPALGFFHRARAGRPALALDLVEEFRAPVADALVLQLTGRRMVKPAEFRDTPRGPRMSAPARRRVLEAYESKLAQPFRTPAGADTTLRQAVREQAARLAQAVPSGTAYEPFALP